MGTRQALASIERWKFGDRDKVIHPMVLIIRGSGEKGRRKKRTAVAFPLGDTKESSHILLCKIWGTHHLFLRG
jgi:hypothetical protein